MPPLDKTVSELVCPALNILRAIELNFQEHDCIYTPNCRTAVNNLLKLMHVARIELPKCKDCKQ